MNHQIMLAAVATVPNPKDGGTESIIEIFLL